MGHLHVGSSTLEHVGNTGILTKTPYTSAYIKKPRYLIDSGVSLLYLVGRAGVEPTTNGLKVRCSTN